MTSFTDKNSGRFMAELRDLGKPSYFVWQSSTSSLRSACDMQHADHECYQQQRWQCAQSLYDDNY